ncbi:MAG: HPr family phosphocarrier protein [Planctomycetes bacterium]|nr:HPr family phosphocarrier protein [Planctomycetota bacterium]
MERPLIAGNAPVARLAPCPAVKETMDAKSICRQTVTVNLKDGLHMVPCSAIARTAAEFAGEVRLIAGAKQADAKSVMDLMSLGADHGQELTVEAIGQDAEEVVARLVHLFQTNFANVSEQEARDEQG